MNTPTIDLTIDPVYQKLLKELSSFGFHQKEKIGDLFPTVYCMKQAPEYRRYWPYLKLSFSWFMIASSIWPAEFIPITAYLVELLKQKKPLPPALILIYMFAQQLPSKHIQKLAKQRQAMYGPLAIDVTLPAPTADPTSEFQVLHRPSRIRRRNFHSYIDPLQIRCRNFKSYIGT